MKVLIIGDIVGQPGRNILFKFLEKRKQMILQLFSSRTGIGKDILI